MPLAMIRPCLTRYLTVLPAFSRRDGQTIRILSALFQNVEPQPVDQFAKVGFPPVMTEFETIAISQIPDFRGQFVGCGHVRPLYKNWCDCYIAL
jgi:hypothetical protein